MFYIYFLLFLDHGTQFPGKNKLCYAKKKYENKLDYYYY